VLDWTKICKLEHGFVWEYSNKRLKFAQLLGKPGVLLTSSPGASVRPTDEITAFSPVVALGTSASSRTGAPTQPATFTVDST
jgi:hypothetical protein